MRRLHTFKACSNLAIAAIPALAVAVALTLTAPPAKAEYVITGSGYSISVKVIPRLGAFNRDLFEESRDESCAERAVYSPKKQDWTKYKSRLDSETDPLAYVLPNPLASANAAPRLNMPEWDIITTSKVGATSDCGYGARRIFISVSAEDGAMPESCIFSMQGLEQKKTNMSVAGACTLYATLRSNQETPFTVTVRDAGQTKSRVIEGTIPEDVLLVSLGDSYASGEGNPDTPKNGDIEPQWMDPWCHRSAYAGPLRAGLRILKDPVKIENERYLHAIEAGAMTIVSFACSGGWVSNGLDGPYSGTRDRLKVLEKYSNEVYEKEKEFIGGSGAMSPQTEQLKKFLLSQSPHDPNPKTNIDLLMLSGGGNDVLFAPLIEAVIRRQITRPDIKPDVTESLGIRLSALKIAYDQFAEKFKNNRFSYGGMNNPALSVLPVLYPDPTFSSPKVNCVGAIEQGTPGFWGHVMHAFSNGLHLKMEESEIKFIRTNVIEKLNKLIGEVALGHGWRAVDISKTDLDDVSDHGWCKDGGRVYTSQDRWFRSLADSKAIQGNMNGSFHPTWELNDKLTGEKLASEFREAVNAEPDWPDIRAVSSKKVGDITYVPELTHFTYVPMKAGSLFPRVFVRGEPSLGCEARLGGCANLRAGLSIGTHGASVDLAAEVAKNKYMRKYSRTPLMRVKIDAKPPELRCRTATTGTLNTCGSTSDWLSNRKISIVATDPDSGVESLDVILTKANMADMAVPVTRNPDGSMEATIEFPADGTYVVKGCARDGVGNGTRGLTDCWVNFIVRADTTPLRVSAIQAYGADWLATGEGILPGSGAAPTIPIFGTTTASSVTVSFHDDDLSGLARELDCPYPTGPATCLHASDDSKTLWKQQHFHKTYKDFAGNISHVRYSTIRVPQFKPGSKARSAKAWKGNKFKTELMVGLKTALAVEPALGELVNQSLPGAREALEKLVSADASENEAVLAAAIVYDSLKNREIGAAWLNMLQGITWADGDALALPQLICKQVIDTAKYSVFKSLISLRAMTKCAVAGFASHVSASR